MCDSIDFKILSSVYPTYTKQDSYVFANCQWQVIVISFVITSVYGGYDKNCRYLIECSYCYFPCV